MENSSVSVDAGVHSITGEGHVPKIRKPYTITKQRERWTEEEHKKFLEALKLYGRAWRKIEEHVGSKTAVQIRSHAQKFFSKVARETSNINTSTVEPIEIPPPRPKRKPMHPYPRKLALNAGKESQIEQRARSTSPHSSVSEQDNRSPTSVLSAVISDSPASADATTLDGSPPPISSSDDMHNEAEDNFSQDEQHLTQSVTDPVSVKLELFPNICATNKEKCAAGKVLKLFGKNVVVANNPSNSSTHRSTSPFPDVGEGMIETSTENRHVDIEMTKLDSFHNQFDGEDKSMDGNTFQVEKPIPLPWWVLYRGTSVPPFGCQSGEGLDKETQVEESCAGSNSGSVNGEVNADMNWDGETESGRCASHRGKDNKSFDKMIERKISSDTIGKGFVPYKRCFSDKDIHSSTITSDDRESQRIRLCL